VLIWICTVRFSGMAMLRVLRVMAMLRVRFSVRLRLLLRLGLGLGLFCVNLD
jgi:hypothetical protein